MQILEEKNEDSDDNVENPNFNRDYLLKNHVNDKHSSIHSDRKKSYPLSSHTFLSKTMSQSSLDMAKELKNSSGNDSLKDFNSSFCMSTGRNSNSTAMNSSHYNFSLLNESREHKLSNFLDEIYHSKSETTEEH